MSDGQTTESEPIEISAAAELDAVEATLADIERAIAGLDDGTFGVCEECAGPVEPDRLDRDPTARRCSAHALG
jgi:RNA polymerase-binding transcription factor DksA